MASKKHKSKSMRRQHYVDPKVQGALAVRVVIYWVTCVTTIMLMLMFWRIFTGPARMWYTHFGEMWHFFGPPMIASFLLLPIVVLDIIRMSNRFAGPMLRLRRSMRQLARGEHVDPIEFRNNDFWRRFAEEFNALASRVQEEDRAASDPTPFDREAHDESQQEEPVGAGAK